MNLRSAIAPRRFTSPDVQLLRLGYVVVFVLAAVSGVAQRRAVGRVDERP